MSFSEISKAYRVRRAYSNLKLALQLMDNEQARDRTLEVMDILWMEMSESEQRHYIAKARGES
jgi:hypothetical protein